MNIHRIAKHVLMPLRQVNRAFPNQTLMAIETAITASETAHLGEIRFVVERRLDGMPLMQGHSARERAIEVFSQLRMWDTELRSGVLIYLLLADRSVEIVADRGIHAKVGPAEWGDVCRQMETAFEQSNYQSGVITGVQAVTAHLTKHFPASAPHPNVLSNAPVML